MSPQNIPFVDLQAQRAYLGDRINNAIERVLEHGRFIMGPEIKELEDRLCIFGDAERVVSCSSGSDALLLPLMAWGIGAGDAVFVPSFTFASTAEMVALTGASPVFVDILPDSFNIDPAHLELAIRDIKSSGRLTPKAVIAVDLFGQIADYPALKKISNVYELKLISDAAQSYGSTLDGKQAIHWADCVTTSFFPAKPLGCYGDGGAVLSNDHQLADIMESLRVHGKGTDKYDNVRIGINGRMDTIQAAILIEKLTIFNKEIKKRNKIANRYSEALAAFVTVPEIIDGAVSTWAQYTLVAEDRASLQAALGQAGVPTAIYYPKPLHLQTAYKNYPVGKGGLPVSEQLANQVLSLPMHAYMDGATQDFIIDSIKASLD